MCYMLAAELLELAYSPESTYLAFIGWLGFSMTYRDSHNIQAGQLLLQILRTQ